MTTETKTMTETAAVPESLELQTEAYRRHDAFIASRRKFGLEKYGRGVHHNDPKYRRSWLMMSLQEAADDRYYLLCYAMVLEEIVAQDRGADFVESLQDEHGMEWRPDAASVVTAALPTDANTPTDAQEGQGGGSGASGGYELGTAAESAKIGELRQMLRDVLDMSSSVLPNDVMQAAWKMAKEEEG